MKTPASRWRPSPRLFNPQPPAWNYPEGAWTLNVDNRGTIDIKNQSYRITKSLIEERVRIVPVENRYPIYYCKP